MQINELIDLNKFRTAPILDLNQIKKLSMALDTKIADSDWLTIGIMARSDVEAKITLKTIIHRYSFKSFKYFEHLRASGNVFMKGNQKTGEVYIRSDFGLGEGILITCQYEDFYTDSVTYGPFPLNFFSQ
tara:strand:- start:132 stop:521 length:390 start_codon:yes stop_codon:yes gene_type:complete